MKRTMFQEWFFEGTRALFRAESPAPYRAANRAAHPPTHSPTPPTHSPTPPTHSPTPPTHHPPARLTSCVSASLSLLNSMPVKWMRRLLRWRAGVARGNWGGGLLQYRPWSGFESDSLEPPRAFGDGDLGR